MDTWTTTEIHLETVDSTMEAAKAVAASQDFLLVSAEGQYKGKGTRGRSWESPAGNVYMTLGVNRRHISDPRMALFPLEIGVLLWKEAAHRLPPAARSGLILKWPNDLMAQGCKTAGILMESHREFLLVGIGVNVAHAPTVIDGGSPSTCLADHGMAAGDKRALVEGLYGRVREAFAPGSDFDAGKMLMEWQGKADWKSRYRLRDREGRPWVTPAALNTQGHLLVEHGNGTREWLVSDYLL